MFDGIKSGYLTSATSIALPKNLQTHALQSWSNEHSANFFQLTNFDHNITLLPEKLFSKDQSFFDKSQ